MAVARAYGLGATVPSLWGMARHSTYRKDNYQ